MRRLRDLLLSAFTLAVAGAVPLQAQRTARIEGEAFDSVHARPLAGATVLLTRMDGETSEFRSVVADDRGRFRIDSLAAGRYGAALMHPLLDTLDVLIPPTELVVRDGERARLALAVPSGATLRAAACPGLDLPPTAGAVVGTVVDAEREAPLAGATIALNWMDLSLDLATMRAANAPRSASVVTDAAGGFRFCGVPVETFLVLQVQRHGRAGAAVRISVPEAARIATVRLSFSEEESRALAAYTDSSAADSLGGEAPLPPLAGTATLSGVVKTASGQPVAGAELRVLEAAATARSDEGGAFTLGGLPAGTRTLEARRVGFLVGTQQVELRPGRGSSTTVTMQRFVSLDSVRVLARRDRYGESSNRRRRSGGAGTFLSEAQIDERHVTQTSDLFRSMAGFRIGGEGLDAKLYVQRGVSSFMFGPCPANVVIDGMQHQDINLIRPMDIGAMEVYKGPAGAPIEYENGCGLVVIWTKR